MSTATEPDDALVVAWNRWGIPRRSRRARRTRTQLRAEQLDALAERALAADPARVPRWQRRRDLVPGHLDADIVVRPVSRRRAHARQLGALIDDAGERHTRELEAELSPMLAGTQPTAHARITSLTLRPGDILRRRHSHRAALIAAEADAPIGDDVADPAQPEHITVPPAGDHDPPPPLASQRADERPAAPRAPGAIPRSARA